jgi:hypothetical protein
MGGKSRVRQIAEQEIREAVSIAVSGVQGRYIKAFDRRAHGYALLGHSNEEIAELLGISPTTFDTWLVEQPSLRDALRRARVDAPVAVARALHLAARGFKHRETKLNVVNGKVEKTDITRRYAPSVQAAQLILTNRVGKHWKDTKSVEHSGRVDLAALISDLHGTQAKPVNPVTIEHDADED